MEAQIMAMKIFKDNTITTTQQIPSFNEKKTQISRVQRVITSPF